MTVNENLNRKIELFLSVEVYLSLLDVVPEYRLQHRKAILDFLCLLFSRDKNSPTPKDYEDYSYYLQVLRKKDSEYVRYAISYVERFYSWLAENPKCISLETLTTPPKQRPRRKRSRRVDTLLSADLYEGLSLLAKDNNVDIPTMLNVIVSKYVAHQKAGTQKS